MTAFFSRYIYLGSLLLWLTIYAFVYVAFPRLRRSLLTSSLLAVPQAAFAILLVPRHWNPRYIVALPVGIEDFLFIFFAGGLAWAAAVCAVRMQVSFQVRFALILKRFSMCAIFGISASGALHRFGLRGYAIPLIILSAWGVLLFWWRKKSRPLLFPGSLLFIILYVFVFKTAALLWPDLLSLWNLENFSGWSWWHIPLEEIVWACLYGGVWPITVAWILDVRIETRSLSARSEPLSRSTCGH